MVIVIIDNGESNKETVFASIHVVPQERVLLAGFCIIRG